ncbi:MAG: DUF6356 family protein [Gammaproteobacteria bacterium]|nr:MAG: DUF6356 family protein [Gammaproteobacteria bacterium]
MSKIKALFTEHPASVGETYVQHMGSASSFALHMIGAGVCCFIHGLLPFLFVKTGSNTITRLHDRMVVNRDRRPRLDVAQGGATAGADTIGAG